MRPYSDIAQRAALHLSQKIPFVIFSKPGRAEVTALFQNDSASHYADELEESGFVFARFNGGRFLYIPDDRSELFTSSFDVKNQQESDSHYNDSSGHDEFTALVAKAIERIDHGDFGKVVLSRRESVPLEVLDPILIFENLLAAYPLAFRYCWYHPETGLWMGATPERLLKVQDEKFYTVALAGTQKFEGKADVEWAFKEKAEQRFVTDFIVDNLQESAADIRVSDPYTARAGNLLHIKTDIEGEMKPEESLANVVRILHPTPAVCGLPKETAMQFILANEGYDRDYYSGFLGEINRNGLSDIYVNLRCMKLQDGTAQIFVGCGITRDSDPEKEYNETVSKSLTMKKILP